MTRWRGLSGRWPLSRRLALIVFLSLMAVWLITAIVFALPQYAGGRGTRTLPSQIPALVQLLERAPPDEQSLILKAVHSRDFFAQLEAGDTTSATSPDSEARPGVATALRALAALGPRAVSVTTQREAGSLVTAQSLRDPTPITIRVALRTGGTLLVQTRTTLMTSLFGLPAGFGVGLLGILVSIAALYALHRETRPLVRLAASVDSIDPVNDLGPIPADRHAAPEIQALINAFSRLHGRLANMVRSRMAMIGGISHDVRTFATRLRLRVEKIDDSGERARAVADIEDMIALLDDALLASRAGAGEMAEELVDFCEIVVAEIADRRAQGQAVRLLGDSDAAAAPMLADRLALRRIVANLVENALKYGSRADLALRCDAAQAVLTVDDDGPGVAPALREAIFEPFVRLDGSRSRATGGAGLGLAIVRTLVRAHGGAVAIGDTPSNSGSRVTLFLPLFRI